MNRTDQALDILKQEDMRAEKRLDIVLDESFIDAAILHEFSCIVAERALARVENPDPRSAGALVVKRRWLRGEATDEELAAACVAADAAAESAAWVARTAARTAADAALSVAWAAADTARVARAARAAAWSAAWSAAHAAAGAADAARGEPDAEDAERGEQVKILVELLKKEKEKKKMEKHSLGLNLDQEFEETVRAAKESTEEKADAESEAKSNVPEIMKLLEGAAFGVVEVKGKERDRVAVPLDRYDELIRVRTERDIIVRLINANTPSYELLKLVKTILGIRPEKEPGQ
jgi:hypothetical protein